MTIERATLYNADVKCGSFLLFAIRLGEFAFCYLFGFVKNLIVNLLGGETIEDIDTAQQVKIFGEICNGICVDLQSFVPCF